MYMENWCAIITGKFENTNEIKEILKNYNLIFSTWEYEKTKYNEKDIVIFNNEDDYDNFSNGTLSLYRQQKTILNGLFLAKKMGFKKALRLRSDFLIQKPEKFFKLLDCQLNLYAYTTHQGGYIVDYIMGGDINFMIDLWTIDKSAYYEFPEKLITFNFNKMNLKNSQYKFILDDINKSNDIFWTKYNKFLSSYLENELMKNYFLI